MSLPSQTIRSNNHFLLLFSPHFSQSKQKSSSSRVNCLPSAADVFCTWRHSQPLLLSSSSTWIHRNGRLSRWPNRHGMGEHWRVVRSKKWCCMVFLPSGTTTTAWKMCSLQTRLWCTKSPLAARSTLTTSGRRTVVWYRILQEGEGKLSATQHGSLRITRADQVL